MTYTAPDIARSALPGRTRSLALSFVLALGACAGGAEEPAEDYAYATDTDAMARNAPPPPLDCSGTQPFWALSLEPMEAVFSRPNRPDLTYEMAEAKAIDEGLARTWDIAWKLSGEAADSDRTLAGRIRETNRCTMPSGRNHPYTILLTVGGETFEGCCEVR